MVKKLSQLVLLLILILISFLFYLSVFGLETKRFNDDIKSTISSKYKNIELELNSVKIFFNFKELNFFINSKNPSIVFNKNKLSFKDVSTHISAKSIINQEFNLNNIKIVTKKNNIKDLIDLLKNFKNTKEIFLLNKSLKKGTIEAELILNFKKDGNISNDYSINGEVKNAEIKLLKGDRIKDINFRFKVKKDLYLINNSTINFKKLTLTSKNISIKNKEKFQIFEGDISVPESGANLELLKIFFKNSLQNNGIKSIKFNAENNFYFKLTKKFKISDLKINSIIDLKNLDYETNIFKDIFINYKDKVQLQDHKIKLALEKDNISIIGEGKINIDNTLDKMKYEISSKKKDYKFKVSLDLINLPIQFKKFVNYEKKEKKNSSLLFNGLFKSNGEYFFENINFIEDKNILKIRNFNMTKNLRVKSVDNIELNFISLDDKVNNLTLQRKKNNYILSGKAFDANKIIEEILFSESEGETFEIFDNLNSNFKINIQEVFIDEINYLKNLTSDLQFKKNKIVNLNLNALFEDDKKLSFTINTNEQNEQIITFYAANAKPIVKKYKFIEGFEGGSINFNSTKKNKVTNAELKIDDFRLKKLPVFVKILTLASLNGIADLLSGDGIKFDELDMKFNKKKKVTNIEELYAIGPDISLLLDGYVDGDKLVSLKGTLVPAAEINKLISAIPVIGDLLVGKKPGEGIFGVSFKVKGPPKDLKTTVNPIKTLTPRFITRTLEKIKKTN